MLDGGLRVWVGGWMHSLHSAGKAHVPTNTLTASTMQRIVPPRCLARFRQRQTGFETASRVMVAHTPNGIPKNLYHLAELVELGDMGGAGQPSRLPATVAIN